MVTYSNSLTLREYYDELVESCRTDPESLYFLCVEIVKNHGRRGGEMCYNVLYSCLAEPEVNENFEKISEVLDTLSGQCHKFYQIGSSDYCYKREEKLVTKITDYGSIPLSELSLEKLYKLRDIANDDSAEKYAEYQDSRSRVTDIMLEIVKKQQSV